jgi:hypothetical protein
VARDLAASETVDVRFRARLGRARTLVRLESNRLRLRADRRGLVLERRGRRVRTLRIRGRGWITIRLALDARSDRVELRARGRRLAVRVRGLRAERRVVVSAAARRVRISGEPASAPVAGHPAHPTAPSPRAEVPAPAPPAPSPPRTGGPRFFSPGSFWNRRLPAAAPVDAASATYVAELRRQLTLASPWINTTQYSTPLYTVPAFQPTERVALDTNYSPLQREWEAVPIPPDARPAAGSDQHLVVHQPATDTLWEFWKLRRVDGAWHARWGGKLSGVSSSPGYFEGAQSSWGATATSLPLAGGLMTIDEVRRGRIDHALALAIPEPKARSWSWPAQRTDGSNWDAGAIPEGTRFRLDPALDLDRLQLPRLVRLMAEAAQDYGIVVRDKAGAVVFYGEDSTPTGSDPWRGSDGFFGGQYPNRLLERFPWDRLQALETQMDCCWHH